MRNILGKQQGSAAVLLTILFSMLLVLIAVLLTASRSVAGKSYADASLQLSGRAILSEYDRRLLSDYGIFAFRGDGNQMEQDLRFYADASLRKTKTAYGLFTSGERQLRSFDLTMDSVAANLKEFSILDVERFEAQICGAAASQWVKGRTGKGENGGGTGGTASPKGEGETGRTLRKESVKNSLPSAGTSGFHLPDLTQISNIPTLPEMATGAGKGAAVNEYVMSVFGHALGGDSGRDTFFQNEVEYILSGKFSDKDNYGSVMLKLSVLRLTLNNAALIKDGERVRVITEMAAPFASFLGIGEIAAFAVIFEAWAAAETRNDILLLEAGKKVAFLKNHNQWATDNIVEILDGLVNTTAQSPIDSGGLDYEGYLRILLFLTEREIKLLRMMDLMQINLKGTYYEAFLMREHYVGYRFRATVDGNEYAYTEIY